MAQQQDIHRYRWRLALVTLLAVVSVTSAADSDDLKKDKAVSEPKKLEKSFLLEARAPLTCPPPEYFYDNCHDRDDYVEYRRRYSQDQFEHDQFFRPSSGPPQPRPLPDSRPLPPYNPGKGTLVTFVAEEAYPERRDKWYPEQGRGRDRDRRPPGRLPEWLGTSGRDEQAWRERCYRLQRRDARLENHILEVINSRELRDCEESCNRDRRCVSFNFRSDPVETVCELTDMDSYASIAQFRPVAGWDFYEKDASSYCSGWDNEYFDQNNFGYAYCSARVQDNSLLNVNAVRRDITVRNLAECEQACRDERAFRCETFSFGMMPGGRAYSCHLTDLRVGELSPRDIEPTRGFEIFDFHGNGRECDRPDDQYDFRHGMLETSSGRECVRGPCRIDRSGGYWYCFTDVAEAVWDYCCDPDSPCEHDGRMDMETCYVTQGRGLYRNQGLDTAWRPCSYRPGGRFAYLTRNSTDRVVPDNEVGSSNSTDNYLLETIDLAKERKKGRN